MQSGRWNINVLLGVAVVSSAVWAQQVPAPPAGPGALSSSLGVIVFPAKGQTPTQKTADEGSCYTWAKTNTGIDPVAPVQPVAAQPTQDTSTAGQGSRIRGAA